MHESKIERVVKWVLIASLVVAFMTINAYQIGSWWKAVGELINL